MWFYSRTGSDSNHTSPGFQAIRRDASEVVFGRRCESRAGGSNPGLEKLLTALIMGVLPVPKGAGAEKYTVGGVVGAGRKGHRETFLPHYWRASVLYFIPCHMISKWLCVSPLILLDHRVFSADGDFV